MPALLARRSLFAMLTGCALCAKAVAADGGLCETGIEQSPIDLKPLHGTVDTRTLPPLQIHYKIPALHVVKTKYSFETTVAPGNAIVIDGTVYDLASFHFHTPAEHRMGQRSFPMEGHFVHRSGEKLAVLGVFFEYDTADNAALAPIWALLPATEAPQPVAPAIDLRRLLPPGQQNLFRYMGSLTTGNCNEGVVWTVFPTALKASRRQVETFTRHYPHTMRDIQPLNRRFLLRNSSV